MARLYVVEQRPDAIEVQEWAGTKTDAYMKRAVYAGTLTEAFRRARSMAGERPGLTLEEMPVASQTPLIFLEARR